MSNEDDDLREALFELNSFAGSVFDNLYCQECSSSLEDYGCDSLLFGEKNFADLILCGKCAADFFGEEDYHSEKPKKNSETIIVELKDGERNARTRIMQKMSCDVLKSLALGMTEKDILKKFPHLKHEDILACFAFAADRI
jgi:Protein of unknown function (DUF433)